MSSLVIVTCVYAPYTLAFDSAVSSGLESLDLSINILFAADIVVNVISAYQDKDLNVVDEPKVSTLR